MSAAGGPAGRGRRRWSGGSTWSTGDGARSPILGAGERLPNVAQTLARDPNPRAAPAAQARQLQHTQTPPPLLSRLDASRSAGRGMLFLLGAVGALAAVRLVAGVMLALGPFFIAFLLFDADARPVRRLGAGARPAPRSAAVGSRSRSGVELALLEPLARRHPRSLRAAGEPLPNVPAELFLVTLSSPWCWSRCCSPPPASPTASASRRAVARRRRRKPWRGTCGPRTTRSPFAARARAARGAGPLARREGGRRDQQRAAPRGRRRAMRARRRRRLHAERPRGRRGRPRRARPA